MKSFALSALGLALAVGIASGCSGSGSENIPVVSSAPPAAEDDQRVAQSDTLTAAGVSLVNQANAEPAPAQLPDL